MAPKLRWRPLWIYCSDIWGKWRVLLFSGGLDLRWFLMHFFFFVFFDTWQPDIDAAFTVTWQHKNSQQLHLNVAATLYFHSSIWLPKAIIFQLYESRKLSKMVDEGTRKALAQIPLLKTKASPRDGDLWVQRLKEEYQALIKVRCSAMWSGSFIQKITAIWIIDNWVGDNRRTLLFSLVISVLQAMLSGSHWWLTIAHGQLKNFGT